MSKGGIKLKKRQVKIPNYIIGKLFSIENHQKAIEKLLDQIEKYYPGLEDLVDENQENFAITLAYQGGGYSVKGAIAMLQRFLMRLEKQKGGLYETRNR